jgi:hypothetical protein
MAKVVTMKNSLLTMTFEVEIEPGERFTVPPGLAESLTSGRWIITVQPAHSENGDHGRLRGHDAFLNAYTAADEGLYDDCPPG